MIGLLNDNGVGLESIKRREDDLLYTMTHEKLELKIYELSIKKPDLHNSMLINIALDIFDREVGPTFSNKIIKKYSLDKTYKIKTIEIN